jgi:hypothetical protein
MALQYAFATSNPGVPIPPILIDPGGLNETMTTFGDFDGSAVSYDKAARSLGFKFDALGGVTGSVDDPTLAKQKLDYALCQKDPHPVIVGVKLTSSGGNNSPGHFVLVTGRDEDGHYTIIDPAGVAKTLDDYPDGFSTRGIVKDPPGDISALDIDTGDNITLLVTDALGNRTGTDPTSGSPLQEIPGSAYFIDRLDDDITGAVDTRPAHMVLIPTPKPGTFTIAAQGVNSGPYTISISAFSQDGSPQPRIVFTGNAVPGSSTTYTINYASTPSCAADVSSSVSVVRSGFGYNFLTGRFVQGVTLKNTSGSPISGPVPLVLDSLSGNATLFNASGKTACVAPLGSPFMTVVDSSSSLAAGQSVTVYLQFTDPTKAGITYGTRVLAGSGTP